MRTASLRKQLIKLLGDSGLRDFKSDTELAKAHDLYKLLVGNEVKADAEEKQPELELSPGK